MPWSARFRWVAAPAAASLVAAGLAATPSPAAAVAAADHPALRAGATAVVAEVTGAVVDAVMVRDEQPTESVVEGWTTETSTTTQHIDGSYETVIHSVPVNYLDGAGRWQEIDNDLVPAAAGDWAAQNAANDFTVKVPEDAGSAPVRMSTASGWVSFAMRGADGAPLVTGNQATFVDVTEGTDLTYDVTPSGVKESITLDSAPATAPVYVFDLNLSTGLTPQVRPNGTIRIVDAGGEVAFTVMAPFMVDSATPEPAFSGDVTYDLVQDGDQWVLTVTPDADWLADPARVYPVVVDPTVVDGPVTTDCWITSDNPTASGCGPSATYLRVGATATGAMRRALVKFDVSQIPSSASVNTANLKLYLDETKTSRVALADYDVHMPNTANWNGQATWNSPTGTSTPWSSTCAGGCPGGAASAYASRAINGSTGGYKSWSLDGLVDSWVSGTQTNRGIVLRQRNDGTSPIDSVLAFYSSDAALDTDKWPTLTVNYTDPLAASAKDAGQREFFTYTTEKLNDRMQAKVNVGNGNLLLSATDTSVSGVAGLNMVLERYYNSALHDSSDPSNLGPGWSTGLGGSVRLEFPASNKVSFINATAARTVFTQDSAGNYSPDEPGIKATLTHDAGTSTYRLEFHDKQVHLFNNAGRLSTMRDKQGNELTFAYTAGGKLDKVTDTRNRTAVFSYNGAQGRLDQVEIRTPAGTPMLRYTYTYTSTTPARLTSSRLSYSGGVSTTVDTTNVDARTTYAYDSNGRLSRVKDPRETTTTTEGGTTEFAYDLSGRVKTLRRVTDSTSVPDSVTGYTYSLISGTNTPCGNKGTTRTVMDGERESGDVNDITTYCADTHSRIQRTVDAKNNVRSTTWGPNSNVTEADMSGLSTGGQATQYTYDSNDNLTKVTEPSGGQATMAYGDTANTHAPTAYSDYDVNGDPASPTWTYDYDDNQHLIQARADGPGVQYRYCWNSKGQLQRIDAPNTNGASSVGLDESPNSGCGTDPTNQGNDTLLTYNNAGELTSVNRPGPNGDQTYTYDALSRIATMTDGRGVTATHTYDAMDRITQTTYTGGGQPTVTVTWTYDLNGNTVALGDTNGANTFGYDELNRLVAESEQAPSGAKTYAYDPADNLTSVTVTGEPAPTLYTYDNTNKVVSVDDQRTTSNVTTFGYDRHDKRTLTRYPIPGSNNDVFQKAVYDDAGRVTCIWSHRENSVPATGTNGCPGASATGLITYYNYSYVKPGVGYKTNTRYTVTEIGGRTTDYAYDPISRLQTATTNTAATGGTELRKFTYTYDYHSNLTREVATGTTPGLETGTLSMGFNDADEMCWSAPAASNAACGSAPAGASTYTYDGNGSMLTGDGGVYDDMAFTYNTIGQTSSITSLDGYPNAIPMKYDGVMQDRRTQAGPVNMSYGYNGLSAQNDNSHYDWFVRDPAGQLVSQVSATDSYEAYYLTDALGSVIATVNQTGAVTRYLYEPYGQQIRAWVDSNAGTSSNDGSEGTSSTSSNRNPWRYASGYYDHRTRMLKFGTRYYIPALARWTQTDPKMGELSRPPTMNPYAYVGGDPINNVDPTGRDWWDDAEDAFIETTGDVLTEIDVAAGIVATAGSSAAMAGLGVGVCMVATLGACAVFGGALALGAGAGAYATYRLADEHYND